MSTSPPRTAATGVVEPPPLAVECPHRIFYIHPHTMGFPSDPDRNPLYHLSRFFEGDYLAVWRVDDLAAAPARARRLNAQSRIRFRWTHSYRLPPGFRELWDILFFVWNGVRQSIRQGRYDAIIAYGPYRTGLAGYLVSKLTGSPLILEIPGNPRKTMAFGKKGPLRAFKQAFAPGVVSFLVRRADHLWLRYPGQLPQLEPADDERVSIFPSFVPIRTLSGKDASSRYILFLGHPWDLKGVDLLIRAWNRLWRQFPEWHLKVVGHCPDRRPYVELAGDNEAIEFRPGTPHPEAMALMEECSIFVLPSRTDAMARVLIEAMAARKPIIASRVDGTPHYLEHGRTALLFESEAVDELAAHLETLLTDAPLRDRLANAAYDHVHSTLSEENFARSFLDMVERTIAGRHSRRQPAPEP